MAKSPKKKANPSPPLDPPALARRLVRGRGGSRCGSTFPAGGWLRGGGGGGGVGVRPAGLLVTAAGAAAAAVILLYPQLAYTAIARLVAPFSDVDWPRQTSLEVQPIRERIGRNELFEVKATVRGVVPETAS